MKKMFVLVGMLISLVLSLASAGSALDVVSEGKNHRWENPCAVTQPGGSATSPRTTGCQSTSVHESSCPEKSLYETEKEKKTLDVLKEAPTPLRTPDTIIRVLMLPYTDSNDVLHGYYYTFLKVEDGSWVLGDYLNSAANKPRKMILHHIDAPLASGEGIQQPQHDKKEESPQQPAARRPAVTTSRPEQDSRDDQEGK